MAGVAARHLSLISTRVAARIEENLNAADWFTCATCGQQYRPHQLEAGVCDICRQRAALSRSKIGEVFRGRRRLLETSRQAFTVTDSNRRGYEAARGFNPEVDSLYLYSRACAERCALQHEHSTGAGTGKTTLAAKIIYKAVSDGHACVFESSGKWIRSLYDLKGQEQQRAIDRLAYSRVLVLDDLGLEPITETRFSLRVLYELINTRYESALAGLVVTSNFSLDLLAGRYGDDRITSRLGGMCQVIEMSGRDWRQP